MTFEVEEGFENSKVQNEVFFVDEDNELKELEKLMEKEVQRRKEIKRTKPRASIPMVFEVVAFMVPNIPIEVESKVENHSLSDGGKEWETKLDEIEVNKKGSTIQIKKKLNIEKTQGVKRKLEACNVQTKKQNSKKAYIRRVQACQNEVEGAKGDLTPNHNNVGREGV